MTTRKETDSLGIARKTIALAVFVVVVLLVVAQFGPAVLLGR